MSLWKYIFMNHLIKFLDKDSKTKLAPVFFSDFLELLWEKNKLLPKKSNRDNRYKLSAFWRN